jgi:hypothetical protein
MPEAEKRSSERNGRVDSISPENQQNELSDIL